jgi:hypothetical protein
MLGTLILFAFLVEPSRLPMAQPTASTDDARQLIAILGSSVDKHGLMLWKPRPGPFPPRQPGPDDWTC